MPSVGAIRIPWRLVILGAYVGINAALIPMKIRLGPAVASDWQTFEALPAAIADGRIYDADGALPFIWSPVAAWIMAGVTAVVGYWPWLVLHVVAVMLLRSPLLIGLMIASYGFWFDAAQGNTLTFCLVAAILALRGNRWAIVVFFILLVLMPRPLLAPVAAVLLLRHRSTWIPVAVVVLGHALLVLASGYALTWIGALLTYNLSPGITIGPTAIVGGWWLLVGIPVALWLTWRGLPGLAGLAASPYIAPQYLMWPLCDVSPDAVRTEWRAWRRIGD
jgi:hypothetical protein